MRDEATFPIVRCEYSHRKRSMLIVLRRPEGRVEPLRAGQPVLFEGRPGYAYISRVEEGAVWIDDIDRRNVGPPLPEYASSWPATMTREADRIIRKWPVTETG